MPEKMETIILTEQQLLELAAIVIDRDKAAALKFLEENIYKPLQKRKEAHCKPVF